MGIDPNLFLHLKTAFSPCGFRFSNASSVHEIERLLEQKTFHLLIVDLDFLRNIQQSEWLAGIRRISFVPVIVLSSTPEEDFSGMVKLGADICIPNQLPHETIAEIVMAQLRRYLAYNHYDEPGHAEAAPFQVGDIFMDPPRRIVEVRGRNVRLRPREFALLHYFMRNPHIALTAEQICEEAWGAGGSYNRGISHPIRVLRTAIEPDPENPIYIETVYRVGYRFTAHKSETCDKC